jgi:glycosyltransferase involved in cell wall biosynthesis
MDLIKIGFWTPYLYSHRGNTTTARRIVSALRDKGQQVEVFAYEEETWTEEAIERMKSCDLYHILHFDRFSSWMKRHEYELDKTYIVTSGGTDVNERMEVPASKMLLVEADGITVFTDEAARKVLSAYPEFVDKLHVIPQSVYIPKHAERPDVDLKHGSPNVLLPAGLRDVKDVFHVMETIKSLKRKYPDLRFMIVGEALEEHVFVQVEQFKQKNSWFEYAGSVPLEQMAYVYKWADIVLNTSVSEGQPIALMEAMYYGVPVIARANGGNESLVLHEENGFIYNDMSTFEQAFIRLMEEPDVYMKFSERGKKTMEEEYPLSKEIGQYTEIYQNLMR